MKIDKIKVYIAAPFFNSEQLEVVKKIEDVLFKANIAYFSPRTNGILTEIPKEKRKEYTDEIYKMNINCMDDSNVMIAVVDDHDIGTMFEIGYFTRKKNTSSDENYLMTYTDNNFGLNVMIQKSVDAHIVGEGDLGTLIKHIKYNLKLDSCTTSFFQNFNPDIF